MWRASYNDGRVRTTWRIILQLANASIKRNLQPVASSYEGDTTICLDRYADDLKLLKGDQEAMVGVMDGSRMGEMEHAGICMHRRATLFATTDFPRLLALSQIIHRVGRVNTVHVLIWHCHDMHNQ